MLAQAGALYLACDPEGRQLLNQAVLETIELDIDDDAPAGSLIARASLDPAVQGILDLATDDETPAGESSDEGSNLLQLAEAEGFEPSMGL